MYHRAFPHLLLAFMAAFGSAGLAVAQPAGSGRGSARVQVWGGLTLAAPRSDTLEPLDRVQETLRPPPLELSTARTRIALGLTLAF